MHKITTTINPVWEQNKGASKFLITLYEGKTKIRSYPVKDEKEAELLGKALHSFLMALGYNIYYG